MHKVSHEDHLRLVVNELVLCRAILHQALTRGDVLDLDRLTQPLLMIAHFRFVREIVRQIHDGFHFVGHRFQDLTGLILDILRHTWIPA